ncbi:MAG: hypothetical protein KDI73_14075, partial [Candidatus Competibacteraceae bacterium]|nr:hypothetical protein [Candidatus Competibacteraceae bacterium]
MASAAADQPDTARPKLCFVPAHRLSAAPLCVKGNYMFKWTILITLLLTPIVVWSAYKPVRVIVPQWNGMSCVTEQICIESPEKAEEAKALYDSAVGFVNEFVGEVQRNPRVTFCSSTECFGAFGFHAPAKAKTVGLSGIVV